MTKHEIEESAASIEALLDKVFAQIELLDQKAKSLKKQLSALKNRENKPKGNRKITNATICRVLNISEATLKSRGQQMGVWHKVWGQLEVTPEWFGLLQYSSTLRNGKSINIWVWTEKGRDKFIEEHQRAFNGRVRK